MKKFKETKLFSFLKDKVPGIVDTVGDLLPDSGVMGVVKNLIEKTSISPEEKAEALKLWHEQDMERQKLAAQDRSDARSRELGWLEKVGKRDAMMLVTGIVGLMTFVFMVVVLAFFEVPKGNREIFIHAVGIIEGVAVSIFAYYYGSSSGSKDKTNIMSKIWK